MKNLGSYPYRCPDCPDGKPFRSRPSYATHRRARHSAPDVNPKLFDLDPLALDLTDFALGGLAHGTGALPTLDDYDGKASR